jgi:iron-sulfur cluster assembly protein
MTECIAHKDLKRRTRRCVIDAAHRKGYSSCDVMIAVKPIVSTSPAQPNFRVGDERLIKVTPSAAQKVGSLLQKQGRPNGVLRVAVVGGGCSGLQYKMDFQDQPANRDILVESSGVKVVVDPKSALYVTGSELDYVDALQDGGFKVKNPNAASSCSCGESFSA